MEELKTLGSAYQLTISVQAFQPVLPEAIPIDKIKIDVRLSVIWSAATTMQRSSAW
jgi:hypothetical protein